MSMIAVTIGVGRCASLAIEAANRCRQFTGLDVVILNASHQRRYRVAEPHHLKFHLFDILPDADKLLYFDSDLWFVADWNPVQFASLSAVRDNEHYEGMQRECERFDLATDQYFNSGLLIIDRQHADVLHTAGLQLRHDGRSSIWRDQTWLNLAAKQSNTPVHLIHRSYNTFPIPHDGDPRMKVVFTNGVFDLLHVGHIRLLHFARRQGDWLVVAINSDASARRIKGPSRPVIPAEDRAEMLFALRSVDDVQIFEDDTPEPLIRRLRPAVLVKGPSCQRTTIPGADLVESWGGRVVVPDWPIRHSTTQILKQLKELAGA